MTSLKMLNSDFSSPHERHIFVNAKTLVGLVNGEDAFLQKEAIIVMKENRLYIEARQT